MAQLPNRKIRTLQTAVTAFVQAVNKELVESDVKAGPSSTNIQTALNTLKTALSTLGFTIS